MSTLFSPLSSTFWVLLKKTAEGVTLGGCEDQPLFEKPNYLRRIIFDTKIGIFSLTYTFPYFIILLRKIAISISNQVWICPQMAGYSNFVYSRGERTIVSISWIFDSSKKQVLY